MDLSSSQIWYNLSLFMLMALVIEASVSAVFSIKFIDELLQSNMTRAVKNILVLLIAFSLCLYIPQLKIFYKVKINIPKTIHLVLSAFTLARMSNVLHSLLKYLKQKAKTS